jgi:hypothetical protein
MRRRTSHGNGNDGARRGHSMVAERLRRHALDTGQDPAELVRAQRGSQCPLQDGRRLPFRAEDDDRGTQARASRHTSVANRKRNVCTHRSVASCDGRFKYREFLCDVAEVADDCPMLSDRNPRARLDFAIDSVGRRWIGTPAHGGVARQEEFGRSARNATLSSASSERRSRPPQRLQQLAQIVLRRQRVHERDPQGADAVARRRHQVKLA